MGIPLWRLVIKELSDACIPFVRYPHFMRGKPPGIAKTLEERLKEGNCEDPSINLKINIGYSQEKTSIKLKDRLEYYRTHKSNKELEKLARLRKLHVSLENVKRDWNNTIGPSQIKCIAEHYGIYEHLFGDAYFLPIIPLDIKFKVNNDYVQVHRGNVIKPREATNCPEVKYEVNEVSLWTLILTNPDGNFTEKDSEYVHWFVGNIPGSDLTKGELVYDYLQPFPPRGIGYQRLIFILYKQEKKLNYDHLKKAIPCRLLTERTFKTKEFYTTYQDVLTPAGLAFFQSDWDPTLTDFFHKVLEMKEPIYEYDFPKPYIKPQKWFPLKEPFNLYLDKYRDEKEIAKEFLLRKLKKEHPFKIPGAPPKFPNAFSLDRKHPSWLRLEKRKERLGWGRINDY